MNRAGTLNSSSTGLITLETAYSMSQECEISHRACEMAGLWHSQSIPFSLLRIDVSCMYLLATSQPCSSPPCSLPWSCLDSASAHNQRHFQAHRGLCPVPPSPDYGGSLSRKPWSASTPLLRPLLPLILVPRASSGLALSSPCCSPWHWASLLSSWRPARGGGC